MYFKRQLFLLTISSLTTLQIQRFLLWFLCLTVLCTGTYIFRSFFVDLSTWLLWPLNTFTVYYGWQEKKKVPERRSGLLPSEKELPERRSGAFRHKNTPGFIDVNIFFIKFISTCRTRIDSFLSSVHFVAWELSPADRTVLHRPFLAGFIVTCLLTSFHDCSKSVTVRSPV
jgi:hypothetical protein